MTPTLMGGETEYAVSGIRRGAPMPRTELIADLCRRIAKRHPSLPSLGGKGIYLANGARLYEDCSKAEMTSPEVNNPYDLVRYFKAGERILAQAAAEIEEHDPSCEVFVCRGNVDLSGSHTTWGSHESFLHKSSPQLLPPALIPHLVTRTVYTGSGGWNPLRGLEFTLSPRAAHIDHVVSADSTNSGRKGGRPILHSKDESLARNGYHRLHLILGDSLYSEKALMLRFGATQLVVSLVDAGVPAPNDIYLYNPVEALQTVAADTTCRALLRLADGSNLTAVQLQKRYLEWVDRHLDQLPAWAPPVARLWGEILDGLGRDPMTLQDTLDWPFRLALFSGYAARRGLSLQRTSNSDEIVQRLQDAAHRSAWQGQQLSLDFLVGPNSPVLKLAGCLTAELVERGYSWRLLVEEMEQRRQFCELDVKLGRLGPKGLFGVLENSGWMSRHRVVDPRDVEDACGNPPGPGTRAHLRGRAIRELAAQGKRAACDWQQVWDPVRERMLDLGDPFENNEVWLESAADQRAEPSGTASSIRRAALAALRGLR